MLVGPFAAVVVCAVLLPLVAVAVAAPPPGPVVMGGPPIYESGVSVRLWAEIAPTEILSGFSQGIKRHACEAKVAIMEEITG